MIRGWDTEKNISKIWRPFAILNFRNLLFWSCDLCLCVFLLHPFNLGFNRTICSWYGRKTIWRGVRPPSWICYDVIILHPKTTYYVTNFVLNFHGVRFRNFWNILYFMFQHFSLKLPISGLTLSLLQHTHPPYWHSWRNQKLTNVIFWQTYIVWA